MASIKQQKSILNVGLKLKIFVKKSLVEMNGIFCFMSKRFHEYFYDFFQCKIRLNHLSSRHHVAFKSESKLNITYWPISSVIGYNICQSGLAQARWPVQQRRFLLWTMSLI